MSRYIDWEDVVGRYPDAAKIGGADTVNSSFIVGAEAEVDARLAGRYTVPFSSTPPLVKDLCIDLVYCKMTSRQDSSDKLYQRYLDLIKEVMSGTVVLVSDTGTAVTNVRTALAFSTNSYRSAFGPDDAEEWSPSDSALTDASLERLND